MQQEILKLKEQKDICILAHSYQRREITEIADFVGDSYALAKKAATVKNKTVIMCGVRFMAETVKILSPEKTVYLANKDAGCPMAEQMDREIIEQLKEMNPGYAVVAYINTTAELKTICDVCVTSSSAVKVVTAMPEKDILFIPDINLGTYTKSASRQERQACARRMPHPRKDGRKGCAKSQDRSSGCSFPCSSRMYSRGCGPCRLCRIHQRDYGIRQKFRRKGIYHRNREQHNRAS